jgi:hypothetical protein
MAFGKSIGGGRRERRRNPLLLGAWIVGVSTRLRVAVLDLSAEGAKLRAKVSPDLGKELWLRIFDVERLATVQWVRGEYFGVLFDEPLSSLDLHELHRQNSLLAAMNLKPEARLVVDDWNLGLAR